MARSIPRQPKSYTFRMPTQPDIEDDDRFGGMLDEGAVTLFGKQRGT